MRIGRPRHGTVAAYLALFVALGGTSYAAASLPRNSVGNAQLKNNAVTSSKVRNGSLTARDFRSGSLPRGPQGPAGPAGAQGPAGPQGPPGSSGANVALGLVAANGTVTNGNGISSANVSAPSVGGYCIFGLNPAPQNVQVTAMHTFSGAIIANAVLGPVGNCPTNTQITVVLTSLATLGPISSPFFIEVN
jgi:hypothetical protein